MHKEAFMELVLVSKDLHKELLIYSQRFLRSIRYLKLDATYTICINNAAANYGRRKDIATLQHLLEKVEHALILGKCTSGKKSIKRVLQRCNHLWHIVDEIHDIAI